MDSDDLMKLGLNRNEAKVYMALIKCAEADAATIIKSTKFHKNIVYDNLEKLISKGLVGFVEEDGRKVFSIAPPTMLVRLMEDERDEAERKRSFAQEICEEIERVAPSKPNESRGSILRGKNGVRSFYEQTLSGPGFSSFGSPQESVEIMGEVFWRNYDAKRLEVGLHARLLFNPSLREWGATLETSKTEVRYYPEDFEPLTETHVQGKRVGIIVWTKEPFVFIIDDENVAESYASFFEEMWKKAEK